MNKNIKNIAKIINSKCRFQNCNDCIKSEDTCREFETAIALDNLGYRKQSETVKEFAKKLKMELFEKCVVIQTLIDPQKEDMDSSEAFQIIKDLAEQYGKEG